MEDVLRHSLDREAISLIFSDVFQGELLVSLRFSKQLLCPKSFVKFKSDIIPVDCVVNY